MGVASHPTKSRDEKLHLMKSKQGRKAARKLKKLTKKGKLKAAVVNKMKGIKHARAAEGRKRIHNIEDDWKEDRADKINSDDEGDILPLDMLDADIDWENSAFAGVKRRRLAKLASEEEGHEFEAQSRQFGGELDDSQRELLPIKLRDGTIVRPTQKKDNEQSEEAQADQKADVVEEAKDPLAGLSAAQVLIQRRNMLEEQKEHISSLSLKLLANPEENVFKLRELYNLAAGTNIHPIIREKVQMLASASLMQVLVDIIPGYAIRPLTDEEHDQKAKKETKKLQTYEEALLRYHLKFLQLCEKHIKRLIPSLNPSSFSSKLGILSLRAMCKLLLAAPHFNYSTNIVSAITKLVLNGHEQATDEVCTTISRLFKDDLHFKMSLFAIKAIHDVVKLKVNAVPPPLLATFLSLKINKVANEDKKSGRGAIISKKFRLKKERHGKTKRKYDKQMKKLESDLKEIEAAESLSNKLKTATECMKQVFHIYFSILKRMPTLALLEPVLEGLSKFAHLLNIEFFEDMIRSMEEIVDQKHLRLLDSLHCVHTVFVILSGDGQALNVDPYKFYKSMYRLISALPFEKNKELLRKQSCMIARCLDMMINARRKQVSLGRVSAITRRCMLTALLLDDYAAVPLVAVARSFFIAHPKLACLVETHDDEEGGGGAMYRPDSDDPDAAGAATSEATPELLRLSKRRHATIAALGRNMLHAIPSAGPNRLDPALSSVKPWEMCEDEEGNGEESGAFRDIQTLAKRRKQQLSSKNMYTFVLQWLADSSKS